MEGRSREAAHRWGLRERGAAIVEIVIALPVLIAVILGAVQFALIYEAKATLNHATLQAARAGAVERADPDAIRRGLARGLAPLHSPDSSLRGVVAAVARINADLATDARIRILNPTREAFADFGEDVNGVREIPNDRLHARSTTPGATSGLNIQDANILRVEITYGYELQVPLVNWFITRTLLAARGALRMDAFEQQLLHRTRLPIVATASVRMQSPARLSELVVARDDLPAVIRFAAGSAPPDADDAPGEEEHYEGQQELGETEGEDRGASMGEGFLGFGSGSADAGGGEAPDTGGSGPGAEGGPNSGNPQQCAIEQPDRSPTPLPDQTNQAWAPAFAKSSPSGGAALPSVDLPNLAVGNPIHVATGNKYQLEVDIDAPGSLGIGFARHYNSELASRPGVMGAGWRHSYEARLNAAGGVDESAAVLYVTQADGREIRFAQRAQDRNLYDAQRASDGELRRQPATDPRICALDSEPQAQRECIEFVWRWPGGRELTFDANGLLRSMREGPDWLTLHYNEAGQLARVVDSQKRALTFDYYPNGRIAAARTTYGAEARYRYDAVGNLEYTVSRDGPIRRYHYEDARFVHHLTGISVGSATPRRYGDRAELTRLAWWRYDELGRGVLSTHANDVGKVTLRYGRDYTEATDAFGRTTRYTLGRRADVALVLEVQGPGCSCNPGDVAYEFNARLQTTQVRRKNAPTLHYTYDANDRLARIDRGWKGVRTLLSRYIYDGEGVRPARIERPSINPAGVHSIDIRYDADERPVLLLERGFSPAVDGGYDPIERRYRMQYDRNGRLSIIDGPRIDVADVTRITYDELGRVAHIERPDGMIHRVHARDAAGRPTRVQVTGAPPIELEYDAAGRFTRAVQRDASGERSFAYRYDAIGRLEEIESSGGWIQRIGYDAAGRTSSVSVDRVLHLAVFGPDNQIVGAAALGRGGELLRALRFAYDAERRLIEVRDGDGPALQRLVYDDVDRKPDRAMNALGYETAFSYDLLGRLMSVTNADGGTARFGYDHAGRLTDLIAPNGAQIGHEYDDFGRRVREKSADRGITHYKYDQAGNLIEKTDGRGEIVRFAHTPGNRLARVFTRQGGTAFDWRDGRLIGVRGPWGAEQFKYDQAGRVVRHTRRVGDRTFTTAYRYDGHDRIARRQLPSGAWLSYDYDAHGAVKRVQRNHLFTERTLFSDLSRGGLSSMGRVELGNGSVLMTQLDPAGRLRTRTLSGVAAFSYELDEAGRVVSIRRNGVTSSFEYDAVNRLIAARTPQLAVRYEYDPNGNRVRARRGALESAYAYEPRSNRLRVVSGGASIVYDGAGNPTQVDNRRYEYDALGRPVKLFVNGKLTAEYVYNAWGERTRKILHDGEHARSTYYIYEQHRLIAEADDSGRVTREYVYVDHHPFALLERGVPHWIHTDHRGAPIAVTDSKRRIVWRADYEPFGEASVQDDPDGDGRTFTLNLRLPGQYADVESGMHYNVVRDYDPSTGRYLTPDPLGAAAGLNLYAYAHADPVNSFDSLGLYDEMVHYYMTYFLALVAGLPQDVARTIAIAAQHIDENALTSPLSFGLFPNRRALPLYHFVMSDQGLLYGDRNADPLTRFYNPASPQLSNLLASTDPDRLLRLWQEANPNAYACPAPWVINDARYQLFGEFLHAYEDTFAHRDAINAPYGVRANQANTPVAFYGGHTGLGTANPLSFTPPDRTYNQDYRDDPSECVIGNSPASRRVIFGLTESQCRNRWRGQYTPPQSNEWAFNELRTLRMEYEIFNMLGSTFQEEIAANRRRYEEAGAELPLITWRDLAGRSWDSQDPEANARIGVDQSYDEWRVSQMLSEARTVLQRYNASTEDEETRLTILNDWLRSFRFVDVSGHLIQIEPWKAVDQIGGSARRDNIGWIPAGSIEGVLLPAERS